MDILVDLNISGNIKSEKTHHNEIHDRKKMLISFYFLNSNFILFYFFMVQYGVVDLHKIFMIFRNFLLRRRV